MMKKTQWLDARRTIRHRWVSYLSIIVIAMLAVIAYLGIAYAARSLKDSASACFKAQNYADIDLISTRLLSEGDVDAVRKTDGVAAAEGVLRIPSRVSSSLDYQDVLLQAGNQLLGLVGQGQEVRIRQVDLGDFAGKLADQEVEDHHNGDGQKGDYHAVGAGAERPGAELFLQGGFLLRSFAGLAVHQLHLRFSMACTAKNRNSAATLMSKIIAEISNVR